MAAFRLTSAPRRLDVPRWAVALVALWTAWVGLAAMLQTRMAVGDLPLCFFRSVTGVPCATCGSTRAGLAAFDGRVFDAFLLNPLMCAAVFLGVGWLVVRLGFGRRVVLGLTRGQSRAAWSAMATLFVLNWVWVIARGG